MSVVFPVCCFGGGGGSLLDAGSLQQTGSSAGLQQHAKAAAQAQRRQAATAYRRLQRPPATCRQAVRVHHGTSTPYIHTYRFLILPARPPTPLCLRAQPTAARCGP